MPPAPSLRSYGAGSFSCPAPSVSMLLQRLADSSTLQPAPSPGTHLSWFPSPVPLVRHLLVNCFTSTLENRLLVSSKRVDGFPASSTGTAPQGLLCSLMAKCSPRVPGAVKDSLGLLYFLSSLVDLGGSSYSHPLFLCSSAFSLYLSRQSLLLQPPTISSNPVC